MPIPSCARCLGASLGNHGVNVVARAFTTRNVSPTIETTARGTVRRLGSLKTRVRRVSYPRFPCNLPACCVVTPSRTSSGLTHCSNIGCKIHGGGRDLVSVCARAHTRNFNRRIGHQVVVNACTLSTNCCSTCCLGTRGIQALVGRSFRGTFRRISILIYPATPAATFGTNSGMSSPLDVCLSSLVAVPIGLTNLPKVDLPYNFSSLNLPVNLRLVNGILHRSLLFRINCTCRRTAS